jgi:methionine biosynthesis protein MetW
MITKIKEFAKQLIYYPKLVLDEVNYDDYWFKKRGVSLGLSSKWQRQRGDWILSQIEDDSTVLDIGCGDGGVLLHMKQKKNFHAVGADISDTCLNFLDSKGVDVVKFDINNFNTIEELPEVDHIMILEVLEHMPNPEKFLKMILPKAKKSIFFSFPNSGYIAYRLRLLFGSFPMQWTLHPGEHLRFWTFRDLKWWLNQMSLLHKSKIHIYEGVPILNKVWKGLFGAGLIVKVEK